MINQRGKPYASPISEDFAVFAVSEVPKISDEQKNQHIIISAEDVFSTNYPRHQNDYMQLFLFSGINFLMITITITFLNP